MPLTESDKQKLLAFLQASHGTATGDRRKITLTKKSTSEIKQADATGKARTIQVEVRKKRTFIKRDDVVEGEGQGAAPEVSAPSAEDQDLARREEEARHQAELIRHQEEELSAARREREERERREREAEERAAAYAAQQAEKKAQESAVREEASREAAAEAAARAPLRRPRPAPRRKPSPRPVRPRSPRAPRTWTSAAARPSPRRKPSAP